MSKRNWKSMIIPAMMLMAAVGGFLMSGCDKNNAGNRYRRPA